MITHEPTAFAPNGAPGMTPNRPVGRNAILALGGAGLVAAGLAAGLMLRPAPTPQPVSLTPATSAAVTPAQQPPQSPALQAQPAPAAPAAVTSAAPIQQSAPRQATAAAQPAPRVARQSSTTQQARSSSDDAAPWREPTRPVAVCSNCGVIEGVRPLQVKGEGSGLGAIAGGVVGGLLGNQVGGGSGRKAMTVIGAVGGGVAGHEIEKRTRGQTVYEVRVRMDDGSVRTLQQNSAPTPGSRVRVDGDTLRSTANRGEEPRYVRTGQS